MKIKTSYLIYAVSELSLLDLACLLTSLKKGTLKLSSQIWA